MNSVIDDCNFTKVIPEHFFLSRLCKIIRQSLTEKCVRRLKQLNIEIGIDTLSTAETAWLLFHDLGGEKPVDIIKYLNRVDLDGKIVSKPSEKAWYNAMILEKRILLADLYGDAGFELIEPSLEVISKIKMAEATLKKACAEFYYLYQQCVTHLFVAKSSDLISFTIPKALGVFVMVPKKYWKEAHYVEALVHESTHIELTMRQQFDPFVTNRMQLSTNPLRKDPRPLDGTFHAAVVMLRVCIALKCLPDSSARNTIILDYLEKVEAALDEISAKAELTERGKLFFDDMKEQFLDLGKWWDRRKGWSTVED